MLTSTTTQTAAPVKMAQTRLLTDSRVVQLQLVEGGDSGKVMMRGEFARCGVATENKRVYPQKLWEREIARLAKPMTERQLYGECDHPADGRTKLARVSHLLTHLEIKDGIVYGEAEILDTESGKTLKAILQANGKVGISSRGFGETRTNDKGEEVVQDNYRLQTFDFVADPADQHAFPKVFYEHIEGDMDEAEMSKAFAKRLEDAKRDERTNTEASLREEFARETIARIGEMRTQIAEQIRGELLSDPAVAGAHTALEAIKSVLRPYVLPEDAQAVAELKDREIALLRKELANHDLVIRGLEEENQKLAVVAKKAGYKFFVEKNISGDPDCDLVRKLVGDVSNYENAAQLKEQIEAVRADLASRRAREEALSAQLAEDQALIEERKEKDRTRALKAESSLREENEKLREALDKSLDANKQLMLHNYAEGRLTHHPQAGRIRSLIESANPQTRKEVDGILSSFREPTRDPEQLESVRSRVRKATRGGLGSTPLEEETEATPRDAGHYGELGVSLGDLRRLSGMGDGSKR